MLKKPNWHKLWQFPCIQSIFKGAFFRKVKDTQEFKALAAKYSHVESTIERRKGKPLKVSLVLECVKDMIRDLMSYKNIRPYKWIHETIQHLDDGGNYTEMHDGYKTMFTYMERYAGQPPVRSGATWPVPWPLLLPLLHRICFICINVVSIFIDFE